MRDGQAVELEVPVISGLPRGQSAEPKGTWLHESVGRLFGREGLHESVSTRLYVDAGPETVWTRISFYEEVPGRPPFFLRALLPCPVRSEGEKGREGATVRCTYESGDLLKRITAVEAPYVVEFGVFNQRLGIERCARALGGSYHLRHWGDGSEVILTTTYLAYLRPRWLWRHFERFLLKQLHRHILSGIEEKLSPSARREQIAKEKLAVPDVGSTGALNCAPSPSHSPR
jgi:hypothetical protein